MKTKTQIVIELPDHVADAVVELSKTIDLGTLLRDALGEFASRRTPAAKYVAGRYLGLAASAWKVDEVARRVAFAEAGTLEPVEDLVKVRDKPFRESFDRDDRVRHRGDVIRVKHRPRAHGRNTHLRDGHAAPLSSEDRLFVPKNTVGIATRQKRSSCTLAGPSFSRRKHIAR